MAGVERAWPGALHRHDPLLIEVLNRATTGHPGVVDKPELG